MKACSEGEAFAERVAESIREAMARRELDARSSSLLSLIAGIAEGVATVLRRACCIVETVSGEKAKHAEFCSTWHFIGGDESVIVSRRTPATVVFYQASGGRPVLRFVRGPSKLIVEGTTLTLCRGDRFCESFEYTSLRGFDERVPELEYLASRLNNALQRTLQALAVCARREARGC